MVVTRMGLEPEAPFLEEPEAGTGPWVEVQEHLTHTQDSWRGSVRCS